MPVMPQPLSAPDAHRAIDSWFAGAARDLPWRAIDRTAWGVFVSEVMLQQTPVARVLPVWRAWMERWPTPADLAASSQADAVRAWSTLGYPRRARRLWMAASAMVEWHAGTVPRDADQLVRLPGVGEYTAAAIGAFAFGEATVVLDVNVRRVIARVWNGEPAPRPHLTRVEREFARELLPKNPGAAARWSAGVMELGALVCTARSPQCGVCPLADACRWRLEGAQGLERGAKRAQAWHGTDRHVRGRVIGLLRAAEGALAIVGHPDLADVGRDQLDRCVASLVEDDLIRAHAEAGAYSL